MTRAPQVEPGTGQKLEDHILLVWREMLGAPGVSVDENFFECGGTSLAATRLATRLAQELQLAVSAADILAHPSVRSLAGKLGGTDAGLDRAQSTQRAMQQRNAFAMRRPERLPR